MDVTEPTPEPATPSAPPPPPTQTVRLVSRQRVPTSKHLKLIRQKVDAATHELQKKTRKLEEKEQQRRAPPPPPPPAKKRRPASDDAILKTLGQFAKFEQAQNARLLGPESTASASLVEQLMASSPTDGGVSLASAVPPPQHNLHVTNEQEALKARMKVKRYVEVLGHRLQDIMNRWFAILVPPKAKRGKKGEGAALQPVVPAVHPEDFLRLIDQARLPVVLQILADIEGVMNFGFTQGKPHDQFLFYWNNACSLINRMAKDYHWVEPNAGPLMDPTHSVLVDPLFQDCVNYMMIRNGWEGRHTPSQTVLHMLATSYWPSLIPIVLSLVQYFKGKMAKPNAEPAAASTPPAAAAAAPVVVVKEEEQKPPPKPPKPAASKLETLTLSK